MEANSMQTVWVRSQAETIAAGTEVRLFPEGDDQPVSVYPAEIGVDGDRSVLLRDHARETFQGTRLMKSGEAVRIYTTGQGDVYERREDGSVQCVNWLRPGATTNEGVVLALGKSLAVVRAEDGRTRTVWTVKLAPAPAMAKGLSFAPTMDLQQPREGETRNFGPNDLRTLTRTKGGAMRWLNADQQAAQAKDAAPAAGAQPEIRTGQTVTREGQPAKDGKPQAILLAGGGGSGKSTVALRQFGDIQKAKSHVWIDADQAKDALPEYEILVSQHNNQAAGVVHEESSEMAKRLQADAIGRRVNIVKDGTMANGGKAVELYKKLKAAGYSVTAVLVDAPAETAMSRAVGRATDTGRFPNMAIMREANDQAPRSFFRLMAEADESDTFMAVSTHGKEPVDIFKREGGKITVADPELYEYIKAKGDPDDQRSRENAKPVQAVTGGMGEGSEADRQGESGGVERPDGRSKTGAPEKGTGKEEHPHQELTRSLATILPSLFPTTTRKSQLSLFGSGVSEPRPSYGPTSFSGMKGVNMGRVGGGERQEHKYIRRYKGRNGKWEYVYKDGQGKEFAGDEKGNELPRHRDWQPGETIHHGDQEYKLVKVADTVAVVEGEDGKPFTLKLDTLEHFSERQARLRGASVIPHKWQSVVDEHEDDLETGKRNGTYRTGDDRAEVKWKVKLSKENRDKLGSRPWWEKSQLNLFGPAAPKAHAGDTKTRGKVTLKLGAEGRSGKNRWHKTSMGELFGHSKKVEKPAAKATAEGKTFLRVRLQQTGTIAVNGLKITGPDDVANVCRELADSSVEQFIMIPLDKQGRILTVDVVTIGTMDSSLVSPREVLRSVHELNADGFVMVHNHPSGNPVFSQDDIEITRTVRESASEMGKKFKGHFVITSDGQYSVITPDNEHIEGRPIPEARPEDMGEVPKYGRVVEVSDREGPAPVLRGPDAAAKVLHANTTGDGVYIAALSAKNSINAIRRIPQDDNRVTVSTKPADFIVPSIENNALSTIIYIRDSDGRYNNRERLRAAWNAAIQAMQQGTGTKNILDLIHDGPDGIKSMAEMFGKSLQAIVGALLKSKTSEAIAEARKDVNTDPTPAQIEAGNYAKGHVEIHGLSIAIENPKGSVRRGTDKGGKPWAVTMAHDYGYFKRTEGKDGDQVDVFIGPHPDAPTAYVVDQQDPETRKFDEHKVLIGFESKAAAVAGYKANYSDDAQKRIAGVKAMSMDQLRAWLETGDTHRAVSKSWILQFLKSQLGLFDAPREGDTKTKGGKRYTLTAKTSGKPRWHLETEVEKRVEKRVKNTWMAGYKDNPEHRTLSDKEIEARRARHPKTMNDVTDEGQRAEMAGLYREQLRRYWTKRLKEDGDTAEAYAEIEAAGKWPSGEPFPKSGDKVTTMRPGLFGMLSQVNGIARRKKDGTWSVEITSSHVAGAKTTPLTQAWRLETDDPQVHVERETRMQALREAREKLAADEKAAAAKMEEERLQGIADSIRQAIDNEGHRTFDVKHVEVGTRVMSHYGPGDRMPGTVTDLGDSGDGIDVYVRNDDRPEGEAGGYIGSAAGAARYTTIMPKDGPSDRPPEDLGKYVKASEHNARIRANYFDSDNNKLASSRERRAEWGQHPVGTWLYDDQFNGIHGHEVEHLREVDPENVLPSEDTEPFKMPDVDRYADWMQEGHVPPPVHAVELTPGGKLKIGDGHRRWLAAKKTGRKLLAWVSPAMDTGGKDGATGAPIYAGLTYEAVHKKIVKKSWILGYFKSQTELFDRPVEGDTKMIGHARMVLEAHTPGKPRWHKTEANPMQEFRETTAKPKAIKKILSVKDTREWDQDGDKWYPVPNSGTINQCGRCGKEHEIHAHVQYADGTEAIVGTTCMKAEDPAIARKIGSLANSAQTLARLRAELAREVKIDEISAKVEEEFKYVTFRTAPEIKLLNPNPRPGMGTWATMGDAQVFLSEGQLIGEHKDMLFDNWKSNRMKEKGWRPPYLRHKRSHLEAQIKKIEKRMADAVNEQEKGAA